MESIRIFCHLRLRTMIDFVKQSNYFLTNAVENSNNLFDDAITLLYLYVLLKNTL